MTALVTQQPVLVTGATGFIGAETVRQLLEAGYRVKGAAPGKAVLGRLSLVQKSGSN